MGQDTEQRQTKQKTQHGQLRRRPRQTPPLCIIDLTCLNLNQQKKIPKGQSKMNNPGKLQT